ncbi:MAG TPA: Ig-like domain-containing protein [Balneolaceae bacterium]|nr:Ig-like domain-containing protein [Balneolaceae bacterium]
MSNCRRLCLWTAALILAGCATPSSPTGGPPDEEGPVIVATDPETGTVNFSGESIILHFNEWVNRGSLAQAIIVEPDIGIDYELDWGRRSVAIEFDQSIPDSTTLIVSVGTELTDTNGNQMVSPAKVAVSTGPEIDEGKVVGRVINAETGEGDEGQRILLYHAPVDLSEKADYTASTDTSGAFEFSYLREGKYKAFWVEDRNRNKIWEQESERAQPFSREFIELTESDADTLGTVYITPVDTTQPVLQGVGLFSSQRLRMRFSEDIQLTDSTEIAVTDTLGNFYSDVFPLYFPPDEPYILFAHSEKTLTQTSTYTLEMEGIVDEFGNPLKEVSQTFIGSAQEDTTQQRIIRRNNLSGYYPADPVVVTYAKPIDDPAIVDSLKVVKGNELIEDWPNVDVEQNVLRISPNPSWQEGLDYEIRVWDPIIDDYRKFSPDVWHTSQLGTLNIIVADSTLKNIHLRIENEESGIVRDTVFTEQVEIEKLPPLTYTVTAYRDQNENGEWDFGRVEPYVKPEPYFIQTGVQVQPSMTGDLTITFRNEY